MLAFWYEHHVGVECGEFSAFNMQKRCLAKVSQKMPQERSFSRTEKQPTEKEMFILKVRKKIESFAR